jgi:hypothetical protein
MAYALWEESPMREAQDESIFDEDFVDWARAQGCPEPTDDDWHMLRLREKDDDSESASESDTSSEAGPESDE